ncbi:MAG: hypothetical protein WC869_00190 [Phycisphaerae bacterium]|jgi:hypothetical protein
MLALTDEGELRLERVLEWMRELDQLARHLELPGGHELNLLRKLNYLRTYGLIKAKPNGTRYVDTNNEVKVILTPDPLTSLSFGVVWREQGELRPFMTGLLHWSGPAECLTVALQDIYKEKGATWEWSVHT